MFATCNHTQLKYLAKKWEQQDFDITFNVQADKNNLKTVAVGAHKNLLSIFSPVFKAMFTSGMKETYSLDEEIAIDDVSSDVFAIFIKYFYIQNIEINIDNIGVLSYLSDKYMVEPLHDDCQNFVTNNLQISNLIAMLSSLINYKQHKLYEICIEWMKTHKTKADLLFTDNSLQHVNRPVIITLLQAYGTIVNPIKIWNSALTWARHYNQHVEYGCTNNINTDDNTHEHEHDNDNNNDDDDSEDEEYKNDEEQLQQWKEYKLDYSQKQKDCGETIFFKYNIENCNIDDDAYITHKNDKDNKTKTYINFVDQQTNNMLYKYKQQLSQRQQNGNHIHNNINNNSHLNKQIVKNLKSIRDYIPFHLFSLEMIYEQIIPYKILNKKILLELLLHHSQGYDRKIFDLILPTKQRQWKANNLLIWQSIYFTLGIGEEDYKVISRNDCSYTVQYNDKCKLLYAAIGLNQYNRYRWEVYVDQFDLNPDISFGVGRYYPNIDRNKWPGCCKYTWGIAIDETRYVPRIEGNDQTQQNHGVSTGDVFLMELDGPSRKFIISKNLNTLYTFDINCEQLVYPIFISNSNQIIFTIRNFQMLK